MIEPMIEADELQQFDRALFPFRHGSVGLEHRDLDVFGCGESGQEMKRLKNETNFVSTVAGWIGMIRERLPAIKKRAGRGAIQCSQHLEQSGFAAATRAGYGNKFTFFDRKIYAAQRLDLSVIELSRQCLCLKQRHGIFFLTASSLKIRVEDGARLPILLRRGARCD